MIKEMTFVQPCILIPSGSLFISCWNHILLVSWWNRGKLSQRFVRVAPIWFVSFMTPLITVNRFMTVRTWINNLLTFTSADAWKLLSFNWAPQRPFLSPILLNIPICVWDVPDTTNRIRVDTTTTTSLEAHFAQNWFKVWSCWEKWQFDHTSSPKASTQIGRTSQNPPKMIWVHEIKTLFFQANLNLLCGKSKTFNDSFDVITLFHWDDSHVIFFVDPDEEIFVFFTFQSHVGDTILVLVNRCGWKLWSVLEDSFKTNF